MVMDINAVDVILENIIGIIKMHQCNDICVRKSFLAPQHFLKRLWKRHYAIGFRWCKVCYIGYVPPNGVARCYCCGGKMRTRSHHKKSNYIKLHPTQKLSYKITLRKCNKCNSDHTHIDDRGHRYWYRNGDGHMCYKCYNKKKHILRVEKRRLAII